MSGKKYRKFDGFTTNAWRRPEDKGGGGAIEEIQRNGVPLPIEDKTVDIEVPEKTSELQNNGEGGSPFATKEYVDQNAGAITAIKRNGSLLPITDKTVDVVVPTKTSELVNDSDFISVGDAATLSVFKIPGGDGGEETTTVIEEELNKLSLNYYKNAQGKLSDSVNMTFGDEDYFSLATTGYVAKGLDEKQDKLTFDVTPTENSTNPVTSGGVFAAISGGTGDYLPLTGGTLTGELFLDNGSNLLQITPLGQIKSQSKSSSKFGLVDVRGAGITLTVADGTGKQTIVANNQNSFYVNLVESGTITKSFLMSASKISLTGAPLEIENPQENKHATTKAYVDTVIETKANTSSPAFTGTPTAPTAAEGTNTTQVATTAFVQTAISNAVPSAQIDGNWTYKIYADNTFEAWFRQTGLSYAITAESGGWYRSEPMSLAAPQALYDAYDLDITFANVQVGHANYPTICSSPTFYATGVNYYVLSGNTRPQASNYTLTCYMRGTLAAKS